MANPAKVLATVETIESFGPGVYMARFAVPKRYTKFLPGQFLHLTLDEFDPSIGYWPESRVFSIASQPNGDSLAIVYSVKGHYTKRMERELTVGKEVWLKLPYGDFFIECSNDQDIVLIAGGTGVAPYVPSLGKVAGDNSQGNIYLYYGIREPEHFLFKEELAYFCCKNPKINFFPYVENGDLPGTKYRKGRLNTEDILTDLNDRANSALYYLSGPPAMIKYFSDQLTKRQIEPNKIKIDSWE